MPGKKKPPAKRSARNKPDNSTESAKAIPEASQKEIPPGMPAPDSVVAEVPFHAPTGKDYRILKTNESDQYDSPKDLEAARSLPEPAVPPPDRPVQRAQQTQTSQDFGDDARRSAELRRKALDDARALPQADEDKPPSQ